MLVCTQHFRAAELHSQDNDFARSRKTCSNSRAMMHGHHFGPPGAHHFGGHPSMGDHPCRMGPMGGGRGWRHRRARGPCGDRAFERDMLIDMIEVRHTSLRACVRDHISLHDSAPEMCSGNSLDSITFYAHIVHPMHYLHS